MRPSEQKKAMSGYAFRATRVCAECRAEFSACITLVANAARVVWWRCEPKRCQKCLLEELDD